MPRTRTLFVTAFFAILGLVFALAIWSREPVPEGKLRRNLKVHSKVLGRDVSYSVYFPAGYDPESAAQYPVIYLLHGYDGYDGEWVKMGHAGKIMERRVAEGRMPPALIVMPDGANDWFINSYDGTLRYEDFFFEEFLPHIEETYPVSQERAARAIGGLSMGGYAAVYYALKHPDVFAACGGYSAAIRTDRQVMDLPPHIWKRVFERPFGPEADRLSPHHRRHSVLDILREEDPATFEGLYIYLDCGDDDSLVPGNKAAGEIMTERGIAHDLVIGDGAHTWDYWRAAFERSLDKLTQSFPAVPEHTAPAPEDEGE